MPRPSRSGVQWRLSTPSARGSPCGVAGSPKSTRCDPLQSNAGAHVPALVTGRPVVAGGLRRCGAAGSDRRSGAADATRISGVPARQGRHRWAGPWIAWWDDGDVVALFPDAGLARWSSASTRSCLCSTLKALLPRRRAGTGDYGLPRLWGHLRRRTCRRQRSRQRGWPTTTVPGEHLRMLCAKEVALALTALLGRICRHLPASD